MTSPRHIKGIDIRSTASNLVFLHHIIPAKLVPSTVSGAETPRCASATNPKIPRNTLPSRLLQASTINHVDLVRKCHNDVLIRAELEVVGLDIVGVPLDHVGCFLAAEDLLQ